MFLVFVCFIVELQIYYNSIVRHMSRPTLFVSQRVTRILSKLGTLKICILLSRFIDLCLFLRKSSTFSKSGSRF